MKNVMTKKTSYGFLTAIAIIGVALVALLFYSRCLLESLEHFSGACERIVPPANCSRNWACFNRSPMRINATGMAECQAQNGQCVVHNSDQACQAWVDASNNTGLQTNTPLASTVQVKVCDRECYDNNSNCSVALREIPRMFNCHPNTRPTL